MEQNINKHGQPLDSKVPQQTDGYQKINDAKANTFVQDAETDEDEIIEKRNMTDYWSLPQKDHRTINQNIKMRNR